MASILSSVVDRDSSLYSDKNQRPIHTQVYQSISNQPQPQILLSETILNQVQAGQTTRTVALGRVRDRHPQMRRDIP